MEAPTCRICLARHWGNEPHKFTKDQTPPEKPKAMTPKERERIIPQDDGTAIFVREAAKKVLEKSKWEPELSDEAKAHIEKVRAEVEPKLEKIAACPVCAERRAKDAARAKRWRKKSTTSS